MSAALPPAASERSQLGGQSGPLQPEPAVVAAIAAAVELCWPRPATSGVGQLPARSRPEYVWRFSGRWWNKPVAARRDRPWTDR